MSTYSDLSRIYTTSFIRQILASKHFDLLKQLSQYFAFVKEAYKNEDYQMLFDEGYNVLMENYRCEYIYKSEIYGKIKKKSKKKRRTGVLTEVRSGKSVADLLWLNGTSIAYEIKTEIDTNRRLESQVNSYSQLFKETVVVSYQQNIDHIGKSLPNYIGIYYLNKQGNIKVYREPEEYIENLNPESMFMTLRRSEYESIIQKAFGFIPKVSDAFIFQECLALFNSLSPLLAHDLMVSQLKNRGKINLEENTNGPASINFLLERGGLKKHELVQLERVFN